MRCPNFRELPSPPPAKTGWPWTQESRPLPQTMGDGQSWPRISVVTPSYNQGQFIEETIRSVLLQGYPDLEYIVIDGGSADGSVDIVRKYERWLAYWASEPDRGQSHAINKGIERATGDVFLWLNSDDFLLSGALVNVGQVFLENPMTRIVTGQARIIDGESKNVGVFKSQFSSWADLVTRKCIMRQISSFFDRRLFGELGMIDESLNYCMDTELLYRVTKRYTPVVIDSYLVGYRQHGGTKFDHNWVRGYTEQDHMALEKLSGSCLEKKYRLWSTIHWIKLALNKHFTIKERIDCLVHFVLMLWSLFLKGPKKRPYGEAERVHE
jgi:glycosyltransferase involved in cell wall biosynthesis